jgi:hypothetical protein
VCSELVAGSWVCSEWLGAGHTPALAVVRNGMELNRGVGVRSRSPWRAHGSLSSTPVPAPAAPRPNPAAPGVPVKVVSQRVGHADVGVTLKVYAHVLPGDDEDAALRADSLLAP